MNDDEDIYAVSDGERIYVVDKTRMTLHGPMPLVLYRQKTAAYDPIGWVHYQTVQMFEPR